MSGSARDAPGTPSDGVSVRWHSLSERMAPDGFQHQLPNLGPDPRAALDPPLTWTPADRIDGITEVRRATPWLIQGWGVMPRDTTSRAVRLPAPPPRELPSQPIRSSADSCGTAHHRPAPVHTCHRPAPRSLTTEHPTTAAAWDHGGSVHRPLPQPPTHHPPTPDSPPPRHTTCATRPAPLDCARSDEQGVLRH